MNEAQEAVYEYAFKRAVQEIHTLLDFTHAYGDGGYYEGRAACLRQAHQKLLDARPGRKTETAAPLLRPGDTIPFTLVNNPGGPAVEVHGYQIPPTATQVASQKLLNSLREPPQGADSPKVPTFFSSGKHWPATTKDAENPVPKQHHLPHLPVNICVRCHTAIHEGTKHTPTTALGGTCRVWNKTPLEITAEVKAYQPELFDNKEDSEREVGPSQGSPSHVEVLHTGMDFTGDWVTKGGQNASVLDREVGIWIGHVEGQPATWDKAGRAWKDNDWDLVERIREGKYSR